IGANYGRRQRCHVYRSRTLQPRANRVCQTLRVEPQLGKLGPTATIELQYHTGSLFPRDSLDVSALVATALPDGADIEVVVRDYEAGGSDLDESERCHERHDR